MKAVEFLAALRPEGLLAVSAIVPDGSATGGTFALPDECLELTAWIEKWQAKANLYFRPNEPVPVADQTGKAVNLTKTDMARIHFAWVDCDPREAVEATPGGWERERARFREQVDVWLADAERGPSVIIDSGNGVQALWGYSEPFVATPATVTSAEAQSKALAQLHGGDKVHDVGRLLRIPFTVNLPGEKKREKGRVTVPTRGKVLSPARAYTSAQLAQIAPPVVTEPATADIGPFDLSAAWDALGDPGRLDPALAASVEAAAAERPAFARLLHPDQPGKDRSGRDYAIARECIRAGIREPADIASVIAAYSPDKFEERSGQGDGQAEAYLAGTVTRALQAGVQAGPETYFNNEEGDEASTTSAPGRAAFGEPIDLFGDDDPAELSTPPAGCLPSVFEGFARTEALRKGVSEAFAAVAAITVAGGAIGNALLVKPRLLDPHWTEPAAFPAVIVARPGRKKSPLIAAALAPLKALDRELYASGQRAVDKWDTEETDRKRRKAPPQAPSSRPVIRQHVLDDATLEKQVRIHAANPRGIIRAPDELKSFLGAMGAYKKSGDGDRSQCLRLFDGRDISLERVGSGSVRAETALMGLLASTQPEKIRELARDLGGDGMLQRLIFVVDDEVDRAGLDIAPDEAALGEYASAIRAFAAIDKLSGGTVRLSAEAHAIMVETQEEIRKLQRLPGSSDAWEGHVSKWDGLVFRILLIFHAAETWEFAGCVPIDARVTAETATKASRFCFFLLRHAWRFYAEYHDPAKSTEEARWIANWLLTRGSIERVTPRLIEKDRRSLQGNRSLTQAAMRDLETAGWVEVEAASPADGPTSWRVNPRIFERFAARAEREKARRQHERKRLQDAIEARRRISDAR